MIAIVNYGVGNLYSLVSSLRVLGLPAQVTAQPQELAAASHVILPGVGAFGDAMQKLRDTGLDAQLIQMAQAGKPLLGICLGMQLLFEKSHEFGTVDGLGLIQGEVCPLTPDLAAAGYAYKVPHMGWNPLHITRADSPLMARTAEGDSVYYVHSYYAKDCAAATVATSEYGVTVTGAVQAGNVFGTQFPPQKSGPVGLRILQAFAEVE